MKLIDKTAICPGDILHVTVPKMRLLEPGKYRLHVRNLAPKLRGSRHITVYYRPDIQNKHIKCHLRVTIIYHERLRGMLFIGTDQHPVPYKHEVNLLKRLAASLRRES